MSVYDRWHTKKPRLDADGNSVPRCREHRQYPSADHGKGDRWQVRWRDETGKQCKQNFPKKGGNDPDTCADAFDAKIKADLDAGTYVDPAKGRVLLEDFTRSWRAGITGDPNTLWGLDKRIAHIIDVEPRPDQRVIRRPSGRSVIGKHSMVVLARRPSLIQKWIKSLDDKGLAPSYQKRIFDTLSSIFIAAMDDGIIHRNPTKASSVKPPKVPGKRVVPWTLAQVELASKALGDEADMVYLGAAAALRQGEIFGFAEEDIDAESSMVHIRRQVRLIKGKLVFSLPKGNKERDVPLPDSLAKRLQARIEKHPPVSVTLPWKTPAGQPHTARLLWVRESGQPYYGGVFGVWDKAREAAGMPPTRENGMHVLRHTAASAWLAAGIDIRTVAEYLGHTDPGFTLKTYAHLMPNSAKRARAAMDLFFNQPSESGE